MKKKLARVEWKEYIILSDPSDMKRTQKQIKKSWQNDVGKVTVPPKLSRLSQSNLM